MKAPKIRAQFKLFITPVPSRIRFPDPYGRRRWEPSLMGWLALASSPLPRYIRHALSRLARLVVMPSLQHKRLVLRPDDILFPLLDAAATHVFQNGEASRNVFVAHEGKKVTWFDPSLQHCLCSRLTCDHYHRYCQYHRRICRPSHADRRP